MNPTRTTDWYSGVGDKPEAGLTINGPDNASSKDNAPNGGHNYASTV